MKYPIVAVLLVCLLSVGCGLDVPVRERPKDVTPGLIGSKTSIPIFRPSKPIYRDEYPPHEKTGFLWKISTESPLDAVISFYDSEKISGVKRGELKGKKGIYGARYAYERDGYQLVIVVKKGSIEITEVPNTTATPSPNSTP